MTEAIVATLVLAAGIFSLFAAIGVLRFPDALTRMHASSKVGTFAGALGLLGAAVHLGETGAVVRALLAIIFLFLTAPIGAHLLGRAAAWRAGQWERTEHSLPIANDERKSS